MANFALLWKARIIEKYRSAYEKEKINSVLQTNVEVPKNTLMQKWSHYSYSTKKRLVKKFKNLCPEGSSVFNLLVYLTTDQTFPNFLMKSVIGFIGGIVFTYLCFMFFVFQLSISLMHATIMSSIIGVLLTLGLAFSYRVRCLVFLLIPQFFSRVGRYTLTCYALVLILTGPATNTLKNSEVLSESMACHQEQIKTSVKDIMDSIKNPFNAMKDWIERMTEGIKGIAKKLKTTLVTTHRLVINIANVLESSFPWLNSITKKCNQKLGTPYQHCVRMLNLGSSSRILRSKVPRFFNFDYLAEVSCQSLKRFRRICEIADYTRTTIVATMKRKFKSFARRVQSLLCVKIHVHHSYSFSSNASRSASQVAAGIVTEIRNRADPLLTWLSWSSCVTSLFLLLIIFRAKKYQHMYDTRSRFDNRYVTKELRNLDFERLKEGKETILPLNRREKAKYITTTSFRLLASEKVYLTRSIVHMVITTFKLLIHMAADYSLYWVLMTIRYHERFQTPLQPGPTNVGVHISGSGPVAEMLRSLIGFLTIPLSAHPSSTVSCLPNPDPPDLYRYTQIGVLIFLLWFFALFEPYGLRLSHVIMGHYRPERAKARALWLYNHILKSRGGFMKFARRKLHKEYKYLKKDELTFVEWLDSILPCWWLRCLLGTVPKEPNCLLCGSIEETNKLDSKLVRCDTSKCPGVYCERCFNDLGQLCTICLNPEDYGDFSDVSLEKGSSEDSNSDCQDFDEQMDTEDDANFKQTKYIIDKPKNICERFELLPKKQTDTRDWFLTQTKSNYTEEDSLRYKNGRRPLAELNGNQRKANIVESFNDVYDFDVKFETNLMPLSVSSKQYSNLYPSSTYYPISVEEKVDKYWRISKHNVNSQLNNGVPKNSKGCSDYPSPKSSYYEIKFKSSSLTVSRMSRSNIFAKNLRHNYKSIFRCSSKDRKINTRLFANETDYCSCDYNFIEQQNVSDYCKKSCFIKSSKSESNSKQTLDNKKASKTPQDEPKKEEASKNNEDNDKSAAGQGDKQEPNKPESKSTCRCIKRMRRLCFCRHRKFSFTPCSVFKKMFRNNKKASPRTQKTNHKKRKKSSHTSSHKSDDNIKKDKDDEDARIYRLSEYIGQQDWKKTKFTKTQKSFLTHKWFNNYYSLLPNTSSFSLRTIMKAKRAANSVSDYGMSRSLRYYCSIGNTEFDQIDWPDAFKTRGVPKHLLKKEEGTLKSLKGESEASPYHSCCCSSQDISKKYLNNLKHYQPNKLASSVTLNFKTEFEMLSKPVRGIKLKSIKHAMSDRFLHLRLRNPLPLVRDFYSSMLDAKMRKTHGKENDGKCKAVTVHPKRKSATCQCNSVCDQEVGDCPNYEFKKENVESTNRRPMLDNSCETRELLVQKPELSKTSAGNQAALEINRREYPISTSNNSLSTVNIRSMSFLIVQKSREQPSNTDPLQRVETVNKSVDTSHTVLHQKRNEITNTTPLHNKTNTAVGSSHFVETVYRPVEQGSQPTEYLQGRNVSSTCHKLMDLKKTVSTYTPRKVQTTNHQKPYIFRPTHNETNCPEDPTLTTHLEPLGLGSPKNKGDDHNSSFQKRQRTVATSGTNNYEDAVSEWERQYQKHRRENEALEQERKRRLQREDNRNRLDNRKTQCVPKRDSLSKIKKRSEKNSSTNKSDNYDSSFQTERHCPGNDIPVNKKSRDVYTSPQRIASRITNRERYPSNDRQLNNDRLGNSNIEKILSRNSVYDRNRDHERHPSSYDRYSPVYDRLLDHDRYADFERRNSRTIPHEIQESYLRHDRLLGPERRDFQNAPVNVPERLERKELSKRERNKMREEPRKSSKRGLDVAEQVDCECAEVTKKVSKRTGKSDAKKCRNSKPKTKTATCQCPPSPMLKTPKLSKIKSDTRMSTDEDVDFIVDEVRTASRCSLRGGRTYTKMVPAPLNNTYPRTNRARSASCSWNAQSESEIGDSWSREMPRSVYTTTSKLFEREQSRKYGVPTSMDCNGCSDNKSLSSQSSRVSCSKSSCCSCPSNKSKCHNSKHNRKKSQKDKVLTKVISDIIESSAFQSTQWAADEDIGYEDRNVLISKDNECSDSDESDDHDEVRIIPPRNRNICETPLKVECYPKPQCHKTKQSDMRRPRKTTIYQPAQAPTTPSTYVPTQNRCSRNRLIARRQRNHCSPCDLDQRRSCLSRLTEYPSSADIMDPISLKRPCRQSRRCPSDIQCSKKSPMDHCAVIKKRQSETSPCNNETSDCTMCMKKASQGTRETASGETTIKPRCILYQKDPSKSKHSPCSDCQCYKKKNSYNICQVPTQTLQQWPTHSIETEEIKGYLRSLCRNCQCEKSYIESQSHKPQAQSKVWVNPNKSSDLRGYLQTTWRNCQCGKIKTVVETINKNATKVNSNCITTAPVIQTLSTTKVGIAGVDNSALSICRNCQCIKKKLGQKSNNTPLRMKKSYDQTEAQRRAINLSSMDLRRYEDCVRSTSSYVAPTFKHQIVPESSYDDLNAEYDTKPVKNKTSIEASTLVEQIEKPDIPEIPSGNYLTNSLTDGF
ncbi:uncharacterized protein LOC106719048 [Papilio machaon]|uniref:uncharacterized protein LOC106719048 n=1 Tax=Papilio machaon TaxID=76193 RepID=UPI001E66598A|nr:uncharacterized protein LOC106719048 [Papilio machaon]